MKDRVPTYPGRVTLTPVAGQTNTYDMVRADAPVEAGTPLNKANLMPDALATTLGLNPATATVAGGIGAAYSKAVADARKKTVIYDAANTASQFVVDVSSIDFSNVTTIGIEITGVNVTLSSGQAYVTLRDANSNGLMTSAMTAVLGDGSQTQATNCLLTFEFGPSVCASRSASNYYASLAFTNMVRCVPLFNKVNIKKADVYIQGSFRSGMNGRTVIWYA